MKKTKIITMLLSVLLIFVGCTDEQTVDKNEFDSAMEHLELESKFSAEYMLELSFGDHSALYYINGKANWDKEALVVQKDFARTYLGETSQLEHFFADEYLTVIEKGKAQKIKANSERIFAQFPCCPIPNDDENADITSVENSYGTAYKFTRNYGKTVLDSLLGGEIYGLVPQIKDPQYDKTQYSDVTCTYTVSEGRMVSCRFEMDVKLFDAMPTGDVSEGEYTLDIHVSAKIHYGAFGDSVKVEKYSSPDES